MFTYGVRGHELAGIDVATETKNKHTAASALNRVAVPGVLLLTAQVGKILNTVSGTPSTSWQTAEERRHLPQTRLIKHFIRLQSQLTELLYKGRKGFYG